MSDLFWVIGIIKKEWLFFIFFALFFVLFIKIKPSLSELNSFMDYRALTALSALLLITSAFKISGMFDYISVKTISFFHTEKNLSFILVTLSVVLSMFLTNDIALFIIVPLTMAFSSQIKNDLTKLVIFEAIAVNVGSAFTPFGNPQNIFIFGRMNISVIDFITMMSPVFLLMIIVLYIFVFFSFPDKKLSKDINLSVSPDKTLFYNSVFLFLIFVVSLEFSLTKYALILIAGFYFFTNKNVLKQFDYFLILTFIFMFLDFGMLSKLEIIKNIMNFKSFDSSDIFNITVFLSQIISNVPATIFISNFSCDYKTIAYGANIAGNGLVISSLANIIALRFLNTFEAYITFHKYSIVYFLICYILILNFNFY